MFDSDYLAEAETCRECASDADCEPPRLPSCRIFGVLERGEHPDSELAYGHQVCNAWVRLRVLRMGRHCPRDRRAAENCNNGKPFSDCRSKGSFLQSHHEGHRKQSSEVFQPSNLCSFVPTSLTLASRLDHAPDWFDSVPIALACHDAPVPHK